MTASNLLEVKNLSVNYDDSKVLNDLSFVIQKGETLGIVGESGSGKSTAALALLRLLPKKGCQVSGEILLEDQNLVTLSEYELQRIRGKKVGFIFQDALAALNPTMKVGAQIVEVILQHEKISFHDAKKRAVKLMDQLGIADPIKRFEEYPFQFSGGMCQRIVIAIAMACNPLLIIADEPTTALDEETQAEILELLQNIQKANGVSILLISHDISVIAGLCNRVLVMKQSRVVEEGSVEQILGNPQHPYTQQLIESSRYCEPLDSEVVRC